MMQDHIEKLKAMYKILNKKLFTCMSYLVFTHVNKRSISGNYNKNTCYMLIIEYAADINEHLHVKALSLQYHHERDGVTLYPMTSHYRTRHLP